MKVKLITMTPEPQKLIETCARISYESKNEPFDPKVNSEFIRKLIRNGHESPLEHASATFLIEDISRACSHQIVRHRLASFTQRSQRYCTEDGFNYVVPGSIKYNLTKCEDENEDCDDTDSFDTRYSWVMEKAAELYDEMVKRGIPKEDARFILPQAEVTSLYMTANFREWRHFLKLRLDKHSQWEIRAVAKEILEYFMLTETYDCFFDFKEYALGDQYTYRRMVDETRDFVRGKAFREEDAREIAAIIMQGCV